MSWNNKIVSALLVFLSGCSIYPTVAAEVCPSRHEQLLRYVDVFDGAPEELATLVPDKGEDRSGYWQLGYIYDAGRFVSLRCKYADGKTVDVRLSKRVERCEYQIDTKKALKLNCK